MNYFKIEYKPIICHLYDVNEHFRWYIYNILFLHNLQNSSHYSVSYDFNFLTKLYRKQKIHNNLDNSFRFDCPKLSEYINEKIENVLKFCETEYCNNINSSDTISASPPPEFELKQQNYNIIKYTLFLSFYATNNVCYLFVEIPIYSYIHKSVFHFKHKHEFDKMTGIEYKKPPQIETKESPTLKALKYFLNKPQSINPVLQILKNLRYISDNYEDNKHLDPDMSAYYNLFIMNDYITFNFKRMNISDNYITMFENSTLIMNSLIKVCDLNIVPKLSKFENIYDFKITSSEIVDQNILSKLSNVVSMNSLINL